MSVERDRIVFEVRMAMLWLGGACGALMALGAALPGRDDLGLVVLAALLVALGGLVELARRWRQRRVALGLPTAWTAARPAPEQDGFGRTVGWLFLCWVWLMVTAIPGGEGQAIYGGWAAITLACWGFAVRRMCAPPWADAHEDELYGFLIGMFLPLAAPVATAVLMSGAPGWWGFVVASGIAAPTMVAWQLRRARRLALSPSPLRGEVGPVGAG